MKFTKHFYIEGQRIVSKLGDMGKNQDLLNPKDTKRAGNNGNHPIDWDNKHEHLKDQLIANFEELGLTGAVFTAGKSGKVPYGQRRSPREHHKNYYIREQIKKYYRNSNGIIDGYGSDSTITRNYDGNKVELSQFYYHPDHLGSSNYITNVSGEVYQHMEYFPFGERQSPREHIKNKQSCEQTFIEERNGTEYTSYLYNGKEFDEEIGLYYYGARYYDPRISMFYGVDPLAEKYTSISPYAYCANNPIIYIDPNGMEIDPASQAEWDKQKQTVTAQRDKLQTKMDNLTAKAEKKGWSAEKLAGKIGNSTERIGSLNESIANFGVMENSEQVYSLNAGGGEVGGVSYDNASGNIVISYGSTANFVHETTHTGQYESQNIAFDSRTGGTYAQDLGDEVSAYKAQFAYSPSSVSGLTSTSVANSFGGITQGWVQGITTSTGAQPYAPSGFANTGQGSLNINSTKADFIRAYPGNAAIRNLPANFDLKTLPTIIYKR